MHKVDYIFKQIYIHVCVCVCDFYLNKLFTFFVFLKEIIMIIKTYNKLILNMYNLFSKFYFRYFFFFKIKQFQKVIYITLFLQIYNFWCFWLILFFYEIVHILLTIVIIHYIFLISFGTIKIFKFQSYYSNSHSLKEITMITKIYHIITIDIT